MAHQAIETYGVSIVGSDMRMIGTPAVEVGNYAPEEYFYVDNLYVQYIIHFGILITIAVILLYVFATTGAWRKGEYLLEVVFVLIALHNLLDDAPRELLFNTFWFVAFSLAADVICTVINKNRDKRNNQHGLSLENNHPS